MAFIQTEISGEAIADAMNDDGAFLLEVLEVIAERVDMGLMRDNAADLAAQMPSQRAAFLIVQFASLSEAIKSGFNMSHHEQI